MNTNLGEVGPSNNKEDFSVDDFSVNLPESYSEDWYEVAPETSFHPRLLKSPI